ncbi:MAG: hypothetical protein JWQ73_3361 [Variovorax sp.]|nr:hypothetical protein [Variovorax sp.]
MNAMLPTLQDSREFLPTVRAGDHGLYPEHGTQWDAHHAAADAECTGVRTMLDEAWAAVEQMDGSLLDEPQTFSFCDTSDAGEAWCDTERRFPESPNESAAGTGRIYEVYLGLMTVCGLIESSQATLERSTLSGEAKNDAWRMLAEHSEAAGRAAYRAVLRLADPHADQFQECESGGRLSTTRLFHNWAFSGRCDAGRGAR